MWSLTWQCSSRMPGSSGTMSATCIVPCGVRIGRAVAPLTMRRPMTYRTDMAAIATAPAPTTAPAGRVLVIDDEPGVANFVARALRRRGFAVDLALSGERGLEVALEGRHA